MTTAQIIGNVVLWILSLMLWAGIRWVLRPPKPPRGYDVVPKEWTVEAAKRAMQRRDE